MITLDQVTVRRGGRAIVDGVSLALRPGEFAVLVGPSGCGKSTTLRTINRLVGVDAGRVLVGGQDIATLPAEALRRRIGYVIQSTGLFPHWTVAQNIAAVPRLLGWSPARIAARVTALLETLQLDPAEFAAKRPAQLSGGQQQRVGVARALAADPPMLLMDEPFGALDPITRDALQVEMLRIKRTGDRTILLVTHDMDEALRLGDTVAVMRAGRIVQAGSPRALLAEPADPFVAAFAGGGEAGLKLLAAITVAERRRPELRTEGEPIAAEASLRAALARMLAEGRDQLPVIGGGVVLLADLIRKEGLLF